MWLVIHRETLASQVPANVAEDGVMAGNSHEGTDSYLMAVDIISAGKKGGSVCYPLVLVGNLNGVLERTPFYQAVEESSPPLLAAFFDCDDGRSVGEPSVTLEDFEPEKAVSPVERQ